MLHFMWMDADGGIDKRVLLRQCDRRPAGRQIAANGDEGLDTGFPGAGNHRLPVIVVSGIVEMGMGIDEHAGLSGLLCLSGLIWFIWLNETNQINQITRQTETNQFSILLDGLGYDHVGQFAEQRVCFFPAETGIGDGDAVGKGYALFPGLFAGIEIAFEHESHDGLATIAELAEDFARDQTLAPVIFTGVVMRTVDHDGTNDTLACDNGFRAGHVFGLIIGFAASASQYDMTVGVAGGLDDGGESIGVDAKKMMRLLRGDHRIPGHLKIAFCAVFEADRHRQPAGHFPVRLAFGGAGADGDPTPEIGDVLG